MISYFTDLEQKKTYKLDLSAKEDKALLFWVQVRVEHHGGFTHARGCDVVLDKQAAKKILQTTALPTTEQAYITALKDYFAADKKVREQFIAHYNL